MILQREALKAAYRLRPQADRNLRRHALIVDQTVSQIANDMRLGEDIAIAAVGGYGRGFLFPASDVDLLVLLPDGRVADANVEAFVSLLWDVGLEPGISVRTLGECVEEATKDVTVDTGLLEMRGLWGDLALVKRFNLKSEKRFFQFRWEAYNVFNHTQYSGINTAARFDQTTGAQTNSAFGPVTGARSPRVMQGVLRFEF